MKVALFKVPPTYSTWHHRPVLGISYLAAVLEQSGVDVKIFDAHFHHYSADQLVSLLTEYRPDVLGATAMTHEIKPAAEIARRVKEATGCRAIVGGPHVTALPERTLAEFAVFDFGIRGEGEQGILDLVKALGNGGEAAGIPGLVHRDAQGHIHANPPAEPLSGVQLDQLPLPALHQYYGDDHHALRSRKEEYPILSSRGCPCRCAFCMRVLGQKVRRRSAENIIAEIEHAIARYGVHTINFQDEIFLSDTKQTRELLNLLIDRGLNRRIRWVGLTRANMVSDDIIRLAKASGCVHIEMGVESGNPEVLKRIKKGITVEQVREAVRIIKRHGIYLVTYFILGHPGETAETAEDTIRLAADLNTDHIAVGLMVPYPGTEIYDLAHQGEMGYRLLTEDWSQYDKYGARSLELQGLSYEDLSRLQKKMYLRLYLKNWRLRDLTRFVWERKAALLYLLKKRLHLGA